MLTFNTRRPLFQDRKVREALAKIFDFEWINKSLFFGGYKRGLSYFSNSPLASQGLPQGEELEILEKFKDKLPPEIFTQEFKMPITNGKGGDRKMLAEADKLLKEAGWIVKDGKRVNEKTNEPFVFEFLLGNSAMEKVALALQRMLVPLGIKMTIRNVTPSQYEERLRKFDYDMIWSLLPQSDHPGNEQRWFWGSQSADAPSGYNFAGVRDPVVDTLVELVIDAPTKEALLTRVHALDRVLQWGYYGIPGWYSGESNVAYWNKFGMSKAKTRDGIGFNAWWILPDQATEKKK